MLRKQKEVAQNALYLDKGIDLYCALPVTSAGSDRISLLKRHYDFLNKNVLAKKKRVALVSMGCGDASSEKETLQRVSATEHDVTYFGVDSSLAALELARDELNDIKIDKEFLCADFGNRRFQEEILELTEDYDVRIYAFYGRTIGNLELDFLADIVADIMRPGDYLWVDVDIRRGGLALDDRELYERYRDYHEIVAQRDFRFYPLCELGVPLDSGDFIVEMSTKEDINALHLKSKFHFNRDVKIRYRNQRVTCLAGSEVLLLTVTVFDPDGLVHFFEARDFKLKAKDVEGSSGHFLFKHCS